MSIVKKVRNSISERGVSYAIKKAVSKLKTSKIPNHQRIVDLFKGKSGLEIGGPSNIFGDGKFIPIYKYISALDGCNFSTTTLWEGNIKSGVEYAYYEGKKGTQYISEATDLNLIPDSNYDFVISSHCLEHVANPMKAVKEWMRVVKKDGLLLLVLPHKEHCFDHKRPYTPFSHLLSDFENNTSEDDLTHLDEILEFHDLNMDKPAGTKEQFKERCLKNMEHRAIHQHVFNIDSLSQIFKHFGLEIIQTYDGMDYVILGRKID